jgi:hypothetical protein
LECGDLRRFGILLFGNQKYQSGGDRRTPNQKARLTVTCVAFSHQNC